MAARAIEREVKDSLDKIFAKAEGRIVITLFSSHIQRIQEVLDSGAQHGRTVVISGKSLANNIEMARDPASPSCRPRFLMLTTVCPTCLTTSLCW